MNNYYAIYPSPNGLAISPLGKHADFELADVADVFDRRAKDREPTIWIANDEDLVSLSKSIRLEYKGE